MNIIVADLKKANIVVRKKVILTSGKTADFYCDFKKVYKNPSLLKKISDALALKINNQSIRQAQDRVTCVAATGYGGIPLATAVSLKLGLPLTLIRGEKRTHGLKKQIEGYVPTAKDSVAVIEDVCTYGTSLMKIIDALKETEARIAGCYVVILRPEMVLPFKYPLTYLIKAKELFKR